jgi:hypothetical protein
VPVEYRGGAEEDEQHLFMFGSAEHRVLPANHVISFPQITDIQGDEDEDEDGLEYDFRWQAGF